MDGEEYRTQLLAHAVKRGYSPPTISGNDCVFPYGRGTIKAVVEYEPTPTEKSGYLIYAKGILTSHSPLAPPSRPRYSAKHPIRLNPTTNKFEEWIYAFGPGTTDQLDSDDDDPSGKWLIFAKPETADQEWATIKGAVEAGELSIQAKVATHINASRENDYYPPRHYVICVFTADWRDKEDVLRHRETLRRLGFGQLLYYKSNEMTRQGRKGHIYRG